MTTSTSFAQMANNQSISLLSALRANTPPTKGQTTSRKFLTLSIFFLLSFFCTTNLWGEEVTISVSSDTWTNTGTSGSGGTTKVSKSGVTVSSNKGYKDGTTAIREYSGGIITVSSSSNITKIVFTSTSSGTSNYGPSKISINSGGGNYSYSGSDGTWTGTSSTVKFDCDAQFRWKQVVVTTASATKYKVTFNAGSGTCGTSSLTESTAGNGVTLPTATICDGWEFAGWATSSVATETTTAPTLLSEGSNYKPTGNCTLYAVYQRTEETEGNGGTENVSRSYTFSNFTAGTQYADNEVHKLDNDVTLTTTDCHFTSELRIYSSSTYNGYVVSNNLPGRIVSIGFNAGNKVDAIDVFGSTNGTDWTKVGQVSVTSTSYKDYTLNFGATNYTYFKLDVAGSNQVRLKSITITWESTSAGGTITTTYYHSTPVCADPCDALQAPNVTATATANSITLSWATVPGATSYNIYNYTTEETDEIINLTYTFNELEPNTEYSWEVEAVSATCNGKGTKGTTTTLKACEKLGNATDLKVETNYVHTDGKTYVKFSWTPADNTKEYAINQKICFGKVGEAGTCVDDLEKNLTWTGDLASKLSAGEYWWSIQALGDGTDYCDGDVVKGSNFTIYSITYNTNGGNTIPATSGTTLPTELPAPAKTGYTFAGWYTNPELTIAATAGAAITQNTTLYAKWTINQYKVTLNPNYPNGKTGTFKDKGGNIVNGNLVFAYDYNTTSMTIEDLYKSLTLDGYEFGGWFNAKGSNPGEVSGSPCTNTGNITGDKTYYAKWSQLYSITLSENGTTTTPITQTSTSYKLPTALSAGSCQDDTKELVGWSTVAIPNPGDKPNSNFYELGATVTLTADQTTFYAVFATAEGSQNVFKRMQTLDELNNASRIAIINAYSSSAYILNTSLASAATAPKESSGKITVTEGQYWTLEKSNSYWKFKNSDNKYLTTNTIPTSSSKSGSVQLSTSGNNEWVIANNTYTSNGTPVFTIYNASSKNAGLEYSNGWILYYSTDFNTSWFTLKLYIPDVSYSEFTTTCVKLPDPFISFVTTPADPIEFDPVNCGSTTSKAQAKTVQVSGANLQEYVSVEVTGPYKIARTSSTNLSDYTTSLTLDKTTKGAIDSDYQTVYIISTPPAQSTDATTGTLTFTTKKGNTLTVNLSTPTVNCTTYALTFNDRGNKTVENYYAGVKVPQPADPTGVCTDPIHYVFDGWAEATVANGSTEYTKVTFPYSMPGQNKTLYAVYRYLTSGGNGDYNLVTSALDDWSGDYLIACNDQIFANGKIGGESGIGAKNNKVDLSSYISGSTIPATVGDQYNVTLEAVTGGYVLKTQDGKYNYHTNNTGNGISVNDKGTADNYPITVKFVSQEEINLRLGGNAIGSVFRYNTDGYFRFYKNGGQQPVYLYKKADGTTLYTTSPACGPMLEITSGKDIYVTSGYGTGHNTVIAQQTVEYRATRLKTQNGSAEGTAPDVKVAANGVTMGGVVTDKVKVEITQNKELIGDKYTITGTVTVQYTPTENNLQEEIQVQLAVDYNSEAKDNFTVHARSLPEEFVIVAKSSDKWYALNADMSSSKAQPANGQVTLNDLNNPTKADFAPCNTIYTFDGVPNTGDRTRVRFQGTDGAWLWASSGTNVGIQNKSLKDTPEGNNKAYNWKLETDDNTTYKFHNDNSSRLLGLSGEKFGMYASGVQEFRILPYEAKCLYNYAPTNLKVSVLKGTYVTLTWDAVAGATKYQYRTDDTNWTDCGTEPTVTINGLTGETKYTYYIRAYHEDAGVSQECIDYAEITFTTADCDDVPSNITYTADFSSITVSWNAAAPTATITYNTKEDGTGGGGIINNATSPYKISGGLKKNTTYYIQILADGTCASPIIPVKTEDVEVDIVEWYPQGIIVDINTDETVGVTLENEVSYGSGLGSLAEDLFFSKYFEGSGSLKMIAIYNGTGKDVDLTDYFIYKGHDGSANIDADDEDKILYPLSELGVIKQGQEIVLYSWPLNTDAEASVYSCSQTFLHSIANESGQDANPRWILCGKDPTNSITPIYSDAMNFNGDDPLLLYKDDEIIDVFGATEGESPEDNVICDGYNENGNYKTRRDESWVANDVSNMDYGKTAEDFPGGEIPDDVNVDDPTITAYTARVIMFRKNTVTSGTNAVTKNTDDFHTFAEEWEVRQVCRVSGDGDLTCAAYQELGTFDYSDYYTKYESMGEGTTFEENDRNADGTVTIPITDLYKHACSNIRVKLTNSNGDVLTDREYKVPIMITTTQGTDGQAFIDLRQNLATKEVDGEGNVIATHPLSLEDVREICKTCDIVVRDNATLTKVTDGATDDHPQVRNVYVYENSSLIVPNGTNYTINNLSLRRKGDKVSSLSAYPDALKLPESAAAPISLDFRLSAENWHWFTLPYNCNINEVTWADGTPAQYNTDWYLMTYDGEKRAETQAGGCWKAYTGTTINAGDGFIIAINGNINNPAHTYELHFPMSKEVLAAEGIDKIVAVRAWGVETNIRPNHKGWNLVGNPYLAYYQRNNITNFEGLRLGQLTGPDPQTGYWEQTGDVPYVVVPVGAGWIAYEQVLASETDLLPFTAYFVQVGNDGKHDSSDELSISFDHTKLQLSATPMPASIVRRAPSEVNETEEPVIVGVALTNSLGESDKTSLVIADRFTNEYEMQADFFKWFGDYYNYYTKPVLYTIGADQGKRAFNALNEELAKQPIPMGMYAAQAGNYTFSLNQQFDLSRVEEVWLYDATQSTYTNLMQSDYTFSTSKVNGAGRFSLSVKLAPKVATSIDNVTADKVWATTHTKQVIVNGLENGMHLWLYDATGKLLYNEPTSNYQHTYSVPQTGTYFVSVMKGNQKQTIKVVVE